MTHRITTLIVGGLIVSLAYSHQWLGLATAVAVGLWLVLDAEAIDRLDPDRQTR